MPAINVVPIKVVPKLWGREEWLVNNELYCAKRLYLQTGFQSSIHYHKKKDETFIVEQGRVEILWQPVHAAGPERLELTAGKILRIPRFYTHAFEALEAPCVVLEISTHHDDLDVVRLRPSREAP